MNRGLALFNHWGLTLVLSFSKGKARSQELQKKKKHIM